MNNRNYMGSIVKYGEIGTGAYSKVYNCDYFDCLFAFKEFLDSDYIRFINDRILKLSQYYGSKEFVFPYTFIYKKIDDEFFSGYVVDYCYGYKKLSEFLDMDINKKICVLKKARDLIDKMHNEYKIIHTDLSTNNILYNEITDDVVIIDFDTYIDLKDKKGYKDGYYNFYVDDYIKYNKIDKDLDIFIFNLTTYAFINNVPFIHVMDFINNNKFGFFDDQKVSSIYKKYTDLSCKTLKKEYAIDYL